MFRAYSVFLFVAVFILVFTFLHQLSVVVELALRSSAVWVTDYVVFRVKIPFLPMRAVSKLKYKAVLVTGNLTLNGLVAYSMSKNAVVALADGLRREMLKFGVSVHTINPWMHRTDIRCEEFVRKTLQDNWQQSPLHATEIYGDNFLKDSLEFIGKLYENDDIQEVVNAIIEASVGKNPKICYEEGIVWIPKLLSYFPQQFLDYFCYLYSPRNISHK
ncbi:hypothetical protein L9F63_026700, partial [Diploptera punctata]